MSNNRGLRAPSVRSATNRGRITAGNMAGASWWPLFDKQVLSATAVSSQQFFAVPKGQSGKTATDTNMDLAGQIPAGQRFSMTGIGIDVLPSSDITEASADAGVAALNQFANDVYAVLKTGRLKFTIGSKDYIDHGPLLRFPSVNRLDVQTSSATTAAATTALGSYAAGAGMHFSVEETILMANQNFSVTLFDLPALPSGVAGDIVVSLYGWLYRNAQ
jgi:hypothetical protein